MSYTLSEVYLVIRCISLYQMCISFSDKSRYQKYINSQSSIINSRYISINSRYMPSSRCRYRPARMRSPKTLCYNLCPASHLERQCGQRVWLYTVICSTTVEWCHLTATTPKWLHTLKRLLMWTHQNQQQRRSKKIYTGYDHV